MDKTQGAALLLDFYGKLLTKRQADILDIYVNDDYSLSEIAENFDVSRQAVHDMIKSGMAALKSYEEKLGFAEAYRRNRQTAKRLDADADELIKLLERCRREPEPEGSGARRGSGKPEAQCRPEEPEAQCGPGASEGTGARESPGEPGTRAAPGALGALGRPEGSGAQGDASLQGAACVMLSIARDIKARIRDME